MINIEELTIKEARQIAALCNPSAVPTVDHPYVIGANYFIRTVTHHHTGQLVQVTEHELVLKNAAWIADDGRFADALAKVEFNEVEPFPPDALVIVGRGSIIDACQIGTLPTSQK